ncbi:CO/xanthine dehydrogenase Mo-binding subunit [Kibdelosporangium banguiense]|uniref:CO/xanthine dehydrogenase Mo-binding subunit n=1 Tax=Kibdelosporangium banguiense TaxID=1365924 RepID=A0ABS4TV89_9PSEU|nr:molybdopterin cofactor-binding domain-containing protein [Kibdelosporangium banguiense]MBP2328338.1 CO/xanthine dehydrogenase Mo-binding subunit [Kibdelosporangium banguiense]
MQGTQIHHNGQIVAITVATTLEQAQEAAELVRVTYAPETPKAVIADALAEVYLPANQEVIVGDPTAGLAAADVTVKQNYSSPPHHHNPIEPHATVAQWDGDRLTVHETSQAVVNAQRAFATTLGIPQTNVRVLAPYLGGGFGCKSPVWPHSLLNAAIARQLGRPAKMPLNQVKVELADTNFPPASFSAGSATIASVTGAVNAAALAVRTAVVQLAVSNPASPLHGLPAEQIITQHGYLFSPDRSRRESYRTVMARHGAPVENTSSMTNARGYSTGAVFVEVRVDPRYGRVRVTRGVGAYDAGRVLNRQTARSQVIGGFTWGIGNALMEHTVLDRRTARVVNPNLSAYLLAVNADVPDIQAIFVDKPDPVSTALGARGFGETPLTGVPAAIGNAIFHATGRRLRDLPFTQDKLL